MRLPPYEEADRQEGRKAERQAGGMGDGGGLLVHGIDINAAEWGIFFSLDKENEWEGKALTSIFIPTACGGDEGAKI